MLNKEHKSVPSRKEKAEKILAIGYSVRHIVCSGCRAGYEMYAADAFGDVDTRKRAKRFFPLDPLQLHAAVSSLKGVIDIMDAIIIGSGLECVEFGFLKSKSLKEKALPGANSYRKILGNTPEKTKQVSNKAWLASRLDELGIAHPVTYTGREVKEQGLVKSMRYPVVAKPAHGGGGIANFLCSNETELIRCARQLPEFLFQEYIKGVHASVSTVSTRQETSAVAVNEQLIGLDSLCAPGPLVYCGNITPFKTNYSARMCDIAGYLTHELGLIGSNGVDFVVSDDGPVVIEVNPRIQGSLDSVECSTGLNIVDLSVRAVRDGLLPDRVVTKRYAAKVIAFAEQDGVVEVNLDSDGIVDVPEKGKVIKQGEPIATAIGVGDNRASAVSESERNIKRIKAAVRFSELK
ncbi:ATP-grasp domain-containing protein [Methanophagales archaeon]|nr:MAG: ATP-grasp domain-containing protein [Methanophagales archaeon]